MKSRRIIAGVAFIICGLDFGSKQIALEYLGENPVKIIGSFLKLHLLFNSGAAFSLAPSATYFFSFFSLAIALATIHYSKRITSNSWLYVAGMVLGGVFGNLVDRIFRPPYLLHGNVVDWIELPHWPTFNLADSSIFIAAILACILTLRNIPPINKKVDETHE